jgi:molybdate transport system ATP-binding protein
VTADGTHAAAPGLRVEVEQDAPMPLHGGFACAPGEMLALVGPSGAGKTSVLRVVAGLMRPASGLVAVAGETWCDTQQGIHLPPHARHVGLVFQHYALMPHLSALRNVSLPLLHLPTPPRRERAREWLHHVGLDSALHDRKPAALSGGQQQRVAVARALAREPLLLLLDEPFSAVDQMSRQGLYDLLADLRRELRIPIVLVTHDLAEARQLADTLVVMDAGRILQQGTPGQIYRSPRNARVADLVGIQNRFQGRWLGPASAQDTADGAGWLEWLASEGATAGRRLRVRDKGRLEPGQKVTWVIQGDGLHLAADTGSGPSNGRFPGCERLQATVTAVRNLGETSLASATVEGLDGVVLRLARSGPQRQQLAVGEPLEVQLDCDWVHVMPSRTA